MFFNQKLIVLIIVIMIYKINGAEYTCSEEIKNRNNYYTAITKCTVLNVNSDSISNFSLRSNSKGYIQQILFHNSTFSYLPRGIFNHVTNLRVLNITQCGLRDLSRLDFEQGTALTDLNAAYNNLTELKTSVFFGADNLQRIDLSSNRIATIDSEVFKNLKQLQTIDLSSNKIKVLPNNLFANLLKLTSIDLSKNLIEVISGDNIFLNLKLNNLNLDNNNIYIIDNAVLAPVFTIKQLQLNFNRVTNITLHDQANIENLSIIGNGLVSLHINNYVQRLHADHNKLKNHNLRIDDTDTQLNRLSLLNNSLTSIEFIQNLTKLTYLDVSFNKLANSVANDTFTKLTQLRSLYMESVNLKIIDFPLFSEQLQLETLDISYNELNSIDFHKLSFLENLKQLYINGNNLSNITLSDFVFFFPNLNVIDISDNNWNCNDLIEILKQLKLLNIKTYINGNKIVKTEKNIRGIRCYRDSEDHKDNGVTKTQIIHDEHNLNTNNEYIAQINQTQIQLTALREENENLKNELNEVIQNLNKLTNETEMMQINGNSGTSNQTIEQMKHEIDDDIVNKYIKQMTVEIEQIKEKLNAMRNDVDTIKTDPHESKPNPNQLVDGGGSNNITLLTDNILHDDIKFIKMGLITVLLMAVAVGIVFVAFKLRQRYFIRPLRRPYSYQSTNTMGTTIEEQSI